MTTSTEDMAKKSAATKTTRKPRGPAADAQHRQRILEAAEKLFSTQGFHGTGLREVAEVAQVSLGNIYNHFETKEKLFSALMTELEKKYLDLSEPLPRALLELEFPEELEKLGVAAEKTVRKFAAYIRLIYVDVIEFEGAHVRRLYGAMYDRYKAIFAERVEKKRKAGVIGGEPDPVIAAMMASITYMYYFTVEHLFGVRRHYGLDDEKVIAEFAKVFRLGVLKR